MKIVTAREAKRVALLNIVDTIRSDLKKGMFWRTPPGVGRVLLPEEMQAVHNAATEILTVLSRRADRLRSFKTSNARE